MSRGKAIEAGKAAVRIIGDRSPLQKALRLAEQDLRAFGQTVGGIGRSLTTAALAGAGAFALPLKDAIALSEALQELDTVFKSQSGAARDFTSELQTQLGLSKRAAADALTQFERFFTGLDIGDKEAAKLSRSFVELAADLAEAGNITFDDAVAKLRTGVKGTDRGLRQFGVNLSDANVEAEKLSLGITTATDKLTTYEKSVINASLITKQFASQGILGAASAAIGDTEGSLNALRGAAEDLAAAIGTPLLGSLVDVAKKLRAAAIDAQAWVEANQQVIVSAAEATVRIGALGIAMQITGKAAQVLAASIGAVRAALTVLASPLKALGAAIAVVTAIIIAQQNTLGEWGEIIRDSFGRLAEAFVIVNAAFGNFDIAKAFKVIALAIERELLNLQLRFGNFGKIVVYLGRFAFGTLVNAINLVVEGIRLLIGTVDAVATAFNFATEESGGFFETLDYQAKDRIKEIDAELKRLKPAVEKALPAGETAQPEAVPESRFNRIVDDLNRARREGSREDFLLAQRRFAGLGVPKDVFLPAVADLQTRLTPVMEGIGNALQGQFQAAGDLLKADLSLAQEGIQALLQTGRRFVEESKLGVLQRQFQELAGRTFRFEVATSFRSGALREAFGIGTGDVDEEQLEVQKQMRELLRKIEAKKSLIAVL